jgi:Cys-rich repeat protein
VDAGCNAFKPYYFSSDPFGPQCVECRTDSECPAGRYCTPLQAALPFSCASCRDDDGGASVGCPPGGVCYFGTPLPSCIADCRDAGVSCAPGLCDSDSGFCISGACHDNNDCLVGGNGICDTDYGQCWPCFPDGGGCSGPNDLCDFANGGCVPNCLDSGVQCKPTFNCSSAGTCIYGCQSNSDCDPVYLPFCQKSTHPPTCGQCRYASDCPGWLPGCATPISCASCPNVCGQCVDDSSCPSGLHCGPNRCGCTSSTECRAALPNEPVCIGLEDDGGSPLGSCACLSSADCSTGQVCETRGPYQVIVSDYQGNSFFGGACIASCVGAEDTYCAGTLIPGTDVCNQATGYCVPCTSDSDCAVNSSQPIYAPNCIPYPDGGAPPFEFLGPPLVTGGGQCGCSSTASCDDGFACTNPIGPGTCQMPCTFVDGVDSCTVSFGGLCNTFTGLCQSCLRDFDCTNFFSPLTQLPASICNPNGVCVSCTDLSQCPADLPGCSQGICGYCDSVAECPSDAGLVCALFKSYGDTQCLTPCVQGDDAGLGSVSDAGLACPTALPYCVQWMYAQSDAGAWCSECRGDADCGSGQLCCNNFCLTGFFCPG